MIVAIILSFIAGLATMSALVVVGFRAKAKEVEDYWNKLT